MENCFPGETTTTTTRRNEGLGRTCTDRIVKPVTEHEFLLKIAAAAAPVSFLFYLFISIEKKKEEERETNNPNKKREEPLNIYRCRPFYICIRVYSATAAAGSRDVYKKKRKTERSRLSFSLPQLGMNLEIFFREREKTTDRNKRQGV